MDITESTAELARLQAEHQYQREQAQAWTNDALRTEGKMQYVSERIQQLQGEQAEAEKAAAEAARVEAEAKAAEAATGAYPVRGDEPTVLQNAPRFDTDDLVRETSLADLAASAFKGNADINIPNEHGFIPNVSENGTIEFGAFNDEAAVPQDAVSDTGENGHLDAEFGDQHPSEEVIYRQTA